MNSINYHIIKFNVIKLLMQLFFKIKVIKHDFLIKKTFVKLIFLKFNSLNIKKFYEISYYASIILKI